MSLPYFMMQNGGGNPFSLGPSIGAATGQDDAQIKALQGSMAMPQAYHSKPVAALPPATPFHPGAAFGGPSPAQAAAMKDGGDAMWKGLNSAVQSVGKGINAYNHNQTQQGLLGDPLGVGANGQPPMPDANGFIPSDATSSIADAANAIPPIDPNWFQGFNLGGFW